MQKDDKIKTIHAEYIRILPCSICKSHKYMDAEKRHIWCRCTTGPLKVFDANLNLTMTLEEHENGMWKRIPKAQDHV